MNDPAGTGAYIVLPDMFPPDLRDELTADADRYVFTPPHPRAGGSFAMASLNPEGAPARAASWLTDAARGAGLAETFAPNEASYQR